MTTNFEPIYQRACERHGGASALKKQLSKPATPKSLQKISDDRWLSEMTKCVFQAGFNWQLIEDKWEHFEAAFHQFNVNRLAMLSDDDVDQLMSNTCIVRNYAKIQSVRENASFLKSLKARHGSTGKYFSIWKLADYSNNLKQLQKDTKRLGGKTAQVFLRRMGVDTLIFTPDVLSALTKAGVLHNKPPSSKLNWAILQDTLNLWHQETKLSLNEISQILALSTD